MRNIAKSQQGKMELCCFFCLFVCFVFIYLFFTIFFICSGFCHTLKWISHGFTWIPHPDPPSHLPLHPLPLGLPVHQARALVSCIQPGLVLRLLYNALGSISWSWNVTSHIAGRFFTNWATGEALTVIRILHSTTIEYTSFQVYMDILQDRQYFGRLYKF